MSQMLHRHLARHQRQQLKAKRNTPGFESLVADNMNEIWKDIEGYEGKYQISSLGRVRSLEREVCGTLSCRMIPEKIMSQQSIHGYMAVWLRKQGEHKKAYIHRLVAYAFMGHCVSEQVNHKDKDRGNNHVTNLEWCTVQENIAHRDGADEPF